MKRKALGKGLKALIPDHGLADDPVSVMKSDKSKNAHTMTLSIDKISPNRYQPRELFDDEKIKELSASIKEQGVLQPIIVQKKGNAFEIIAGERRWRASKLAGLTSIPVIIKDVSDAESLELALIENIQRENLNPIEEGRAYKKLMDEFGLTQEELASRVGKERSTVANCMRLLKLPLSMQDDVSENLLSMGHARAILSLPSTFEQAHLRDRIVREGLSVRSVEALIKGEKKSPKKNKTVEKDVHLVNFEEKLQKILGTKVRIINKKGRGKVEIEFYSEEELENILNTIIGG